MSQETTVSSQNAPADTKLTLIQLIELVKAQGFITYQQANDYLPDEAGDSRKVDLLLDTVERLGVRFAEGEHCVEVAPEEEATAEDADREALLSEELPKLTDDPIRMYLAQMCRIPLLSREEEITLAKKIEITRKQFRRNILESFFALQETFETLEKVHAGELPFDRTIKVSLTERLTKEQISARMPVNLPTLRRLMEEQRKLFAIQTSRQAAQEEREAARNKVPAQSEEDAGSRGRTQPENTSSVASYGAARRDVSKNGLLTFSVRAASSGRRSGSARESCTE